MTYKLKKENFNFLKRDFGFVFNPKFSMFANSIPSLELIQIILKKRDITPFGVLAYILIQITNNIPNLN